MYTTGTHPKKITGKAAELATKSGDVYAKRQQKARENNQQFKEK
jgi:hypothetical protein